MNYQTQQALEAMATMILVTMGVGAVRPIVLQFASYSKAKIEAIVKEGTRKEVEWGIEMYGEKKWGEELWGKITNGNITLFHGADKFELDGILKHGLLPSYSGWGFEPEEVEETPPKEKPAPSVWLAYTPYLAFFFGNVAVQVTIPWSWVVEANDGVLVEKAVPPTMIDRYLAVEDWK